MSRTIVAFSASPRRKGNSDILADHILGGAQQAGASVEKVRLHGLAIGPCRACDVCQQSVDTPCVQHDDMPGLLDKVRGADGIVLASPIYFFSVNAQMKLFLDRLYALFGMEVFDVLEGRPVAIALAYGDPNPLHSGAMNALRMFQDACTFLRMELCGCVHASCADEGVVLDRPDLLEEARELGRKVASA